MTDKTASLEAVCQYVHSDQTLGLGGMTNYRRPLAFVRHLLRLSSPPTNLTLLTFTGGLGADMLVGAGLAKRIRACYFGLEIFGMAPMYTKAASNGQIEIVEESEASIANGLRANMAGVGFMPSQAWQGTDMLRIRPDVKSILDPYTEQKLTAFPAINCDVAVIHAIQSDRYGNCILGGNPTIDYELAAIADKVVITTEVIVDKIQSPIDIAGLRVTAVVQCPNGAWPSSCYPLYPIDGEAILRYIDACNGDDFDQYLASIPV